MLTAVAILAVVAGILCVLGMIPQTNQWPVLPVAGLLLAVAVFLLGGH